MLPKDPTALTHVAFVPIHMSRHYAPVQRLLHSGVHNVDERVLYVFHSIHRDASISGTQLKYMGCFAVDFTNFNYVAAPLFVRDCDKAARAAG